jgi:hypothetical protein
MKATNANGRETQAEDATRLDCGMASGEAIGDLHVLDTAEGELRQHVKTSPGYVRATVARAMADPIVAHKRAIMLDAFYDQRVVEQFAGQHRGGRRVGALLPAMVLSLTAAGEAALCYAGVSLAVPDLSQAGDDPLLRWIVTGGAPLAAMAIGVLSALVTLHVGRQIKTAHRGVFQDPPKPIRKEIDHEAY